MDGRAERRRPQRGAREYVVLISAEDLAGIEATLELLADPDAQERLRRAEAEVASGDAVEEDELPDVLARLRRR